MINNVYWYLYEVPVILVRCYEDLNIFNRFSKDTQISNVLKIRLVGAKLLHTGRRTDRHDEANSGLRNLANEPNSCLIERQCAKLSDTSLALKQK